MKISTLYELILSLSLQFSSQIGFFLFFSKDAPYVIIHTFIEYDEIQSTKVSEVQTNAAEIYQKQENFGKSIKHLPLSLWLLVSVFIRFSKIKLFEMSKI